MTIYGDAPNHKRKPHPQGILEALKAMNCTKNEVVLVGDSKVDIETALMAGIKFCPVAWGFQSADLLHAISNIPPIHSIKEIFQFIETISYN